MSGTEEPPTKAWDVGRLTESTRERVPMAAHTRIEVVEAERGRVRLRMPLEGNGNHIGTMYAGALFTLAEVPGGTLFSTSFDAERYYPIVKQVQIRFRRPALTDIEVEARLTKDQIEGLSAEADTQGKADYSLVCELTDSNGEVVARAHNDYQLRAHGS